MCNQDLNFFSAILGRRFYFSGGVNFTVSRSPTANMTIADDLSISRYHCLISSSSCGVFVKDCNSKYGTHIGQYLLEIKPVPKENAVMLQIGHIVRFGRSDSTFRLENIKLKVFASTLSQDETEKLAKQLKDIDGVFLDKWTTECTHLVMSSVAVSRSEEE